jgi:serine phosphatase RsbU (regulator of sigma subunit)
MAAPLLFRGEAFGIIHVEAMAGTAEFDQADLDLLGGIASHTAVALRLARLLDEQRVQERIEKDLTIARQIQRNLLPREPPRVSGIEFAVHYEPAFRIGGDFYDFVWLDETHLGIVIGDVSGKAVSGALFMARVASEIRAQAALLREPRRILRKVHRALSDGADHGVFCTAIVISLDMQRNVLRIANAGHTLPLLGRGGRWQPIDDTGARSTPLGLQPELDAGEVEVPLLPGDRLFLYTDGLVDATPQDAAAAYGESRLREALTHTGETARAAIDGVLRDVGRWVRSTPPHDDQTLLCIRVTGTSSRRHPSEMPVQRPSGLTAARST